MLLEIAHLAWNVTVSRLTLSKSNRKITEISYPFQLSGLEDENSAFFKHGRRLFDLNAFELLKFIFVSSFPDLSRKLHLKMNHAESSEFFLNTFLENFKYRENNNIKRNDFVSLLMEFKEHFKPEELAAEGFIVFAGGVSQS